jgi:hypothetical protein
VTARRLINNVVCLFGLPHKLVSDRGAAFVSTLWKEVFTTLGVELNLSSSRHPETDGQTENKNRTVVTWLRQFVDQQEQGAWSRWLGVCEFSLNSATNTDMAMSPFEVDLGRQPRAPQDLTPPPQAAAASAEFLVHLEATLHQAQDAIAVSQERQANNADAKRRHDEFGVGTLVLLSAKGVRDQNDEIRESYRIKKKLSPVVYELELPEQMRCHPVFHISKLRRYIQGPESKQRQPEDPQPPTKDPLLFEVEKVLKERTRRGRKEVLVQWKGWANEHNTWVPKANVDKATRDLARAQDPVPSRQGQRATQEAPNPVQPRVITTTRSGRVVRSYAQAVSG